MFPAIALAKACSIPVVPASVRASAPSTSLKQAWSAKCRRVLHACSSKNVTTTLKHANQHQGHQASSDVALTTSSCPSAFRQRGDGSCPAMHADLLLESWKAHTLTQIAGKPVSKRQAETAPVQRAGGGSVANNGKSAGASTISPSMHQGFLRKMVEASDSKDAPEFHSVSILVDSGSQQAPLCSTAIAQRLGVRMRHIQLVRGASRGATLADLRCGVV